MRYVNRVESLWEQDVGGSIPLTPILLLRWMRDLLSGGPFFLRVSKRISPDVFFASGR